MLPQSTHSRHSLHSTAAPTGQIVFPCADVKEKLVAAGTDAMATTPDEFAAAIKSEMAKRGQLIRDAGIRELFF